MKNIMMKNYLKNALAKQYKSTELVELGSFFKIFITLTTLYISEIF